jgi:hypothetical protein
MGMGDARLRRRVRWLLLLGVGVLYGLSIPWYRDGGAEPELWLGLPDWVAVAIACYVGAAILNAAAWLLTDVPEDDPK